jgi:hypothetical protein
MSEIETLVDEVLNDGLDDWTMLVNIVRTAEDQHPDDPTLSRAVAIELLRELVEGGWMVPGDLGTSGFEPWDSSPAESVRRILAELDKTGWDVVTNVIAWFDNTEKGNERARAA